jgi:leucyl/phenylalanyl-tRNA--protein transferase
MPVFRLTDDYIFPRTNLAEENGLLAVGGDLCPGRLITAYSLGIFPWFSEGDPILWWYTSPRLVIYPEKFRISKRLGRYMRKPLFRVSFDLAFEEVIAACADIRQNDGEGTWITDEMRDAYIELHRLGYAHSVECWHDDILAGGLYGVALDRVFFGESMFTVRDNSSKVALASLTAFLQKRGFRLIDCQMTTEHLLQFGACEISGSDFSRHLRKYIQKLSPDGKWNYESIK